jgi:hypothetical protein
VKPEGGSEWELIKILLEGDGNSNKMNSVVCPTSHAPQTNFCLPRPRSHWSANGTRNYQEPQLLHTHGSKNNSEAACLEGQLDRVWGAVRPPPPGNQENFQTTSSELQNSPRFHQQKSLVRAKLATRKS